MTYHMISPRQLVARRLALQEALVLSAGLQQPALRAVLALPVASQQPVLPEELVSQADL
jgi:hypothetical protein